MARKRRNRRSPDRMVTQQRDYLHIPTPTRAVDHILDLEDRREWAPPETYPRGLFHRSTRSEVAQPNVNKPNAVPHKVVFQAPMEVALCVRRKQRREVLFALRKTGKGARRRYRRRTPYSNMEC